MKTEYPEEYRGNRSKPVLNVPQFGEKLRTAKTKHIPFMWHVENVSSFRRGLK